MATVGTNDRRQQYVRTPLLERTPSQDNFRRSLSPGRLPKSPGLHPVGSSTARTVTYFPPPTDDSIENTTTLLEALFPWWTFYYVVDFLVAASLWGVSTWTGSMRPYLREINILDPDITRPYHPGDIVPMKLVTFITVFVPLTCCITYHLLLLISRWSHDYYRRSNRIMRKYLVRESVAYFLHDLHHFALALLLATGATKVMTDLFKVWMGRFRPDFLDRCQYDMVIMDCTGENKLIRDGRESWPSGHSSSSFCGMGLVSLYLAGKLSAWCVDERPNDGRVFSLVVSVIPLMGAAYIAISRTEENKHHPTDILSGALLGFTIAYISYRMLYPNVFSGDRRFMKRPKGFSEETEYDGLEGQDGQTLYSNV